MFENMEISVTINEDVVESTHQKTTRSDSNRAGHSSQKIGDGTSTKIYSDMRKRSGECKQSYAYFLGNRYQLTCLIHWPVNISDE